MGQGSNSSASDYYRRSLVKEINDGFISTTNESKGRACGACEPAIPCNERPEFVETRFVHHPFTTVDVADVSLQTKLAGPHLRCSIFINAITGGKSTTTALNQRLAILARETGMAMATGSMSIAMKFPESAKASRWFARKIQTVSSLRTSGRITTLKPLNVPSNSSKPNAIQIHVNRAQELVMPEGDRVFSNWLKTSKKSSKRVPFRYRQRSRIRI